MTPLLAQRVLPGFEHLVPRAAHNAHVSLWDDETMCWYVDALGWRVGVGGWPFISGSLDYCAKTLEEMEQVTSRFLLRETR